MLLFDIIVQKLCDAVPTITFIFKKKNIILDVSHHPEKFRAKDCVS